MHPDDITDTRWVSIPSVGHDWWLRVCPFCTGTRLSIDIYDMTATVECHSVGCYARGPEGTNVEDIHKAVDMAVWKWNEVRR